MLVFTDLPNLHRKRNHMNCILLTIAAKCAIFLAASVVTTVFVAAPAFATERMLAGQYETTTVTADGKSRTGTRCITAEDAKTANDDANVGRAYMEKASKGTCKVTAYDFVGDTVSTTMVCGKATVIGRQTFHGNDAFDGDTRITSEGKTMLAAHFTSKRLGACK